MRDTCDICLYEIDFPDENRKVICPHCEARYENDGEYWDLESGEIQRAIAEALAERTEACAKIAEKLDVSYMSAPNAVKHIAARIRGLERKGEGT